MMIGWWTGGSSELQEDGRKCSAEKIAKQLSGFLLFIAYSPNGCSDSSFRKACLENKRGTVVHNKSDIQQPKELSIMGLLYFSLK
jgi:hypothetical protein